MLGLSVSAVLLRAGPAYAVPIGAFLTVLGATALGWLEPAATRLARHRRIADAPQALDLLASCLAAGLPIRAALRAVVDVLDGPLADDLRQVLRLLVHADVARQERHGQVEAAARRVGVRSVLPLMTCFIPAFLLLGVVPTVASALLKALTF
jgi:Flp pilus assembly protein TadB